MTFLQRRGWITDQNVYARRGIVAGESYHQLAHPFAIQQARIQIGTKDAQVALCTSQQFVAGLLVVCAIVTQWAIVAYWLHQRASSLNIWRCGMLASRKIPPLTV